MNMVPNQATLNLRPNTLLVFIDETGNEDYSDPQNRTFGRGGCAVLGEQYKFLIKKPWRKLKREKLGGANNPFHATTFEASKPNTIQITAINTFLQQPFWRFATMSDFRTKLPHGMDGHRAISLVTQKFISDVVTKHNVLNLALIFESSARGNSLVERDFDLSCMKFTNILGYPVNVDGYFIEKKYMEAGLEVADLIVHTAGRQRRHEMAGNIGFKKDFQQMYWHSPIPPNFIRIDSIEEKASNPNNSGLENNEISSEKIDM